LGGLVWPATAGPPEQATPPRRPERLYRIVTALDPPLADFKSNAELGKPPFDTEITDPDEYRSISTFLDAAQAEREARKRPNWPLGRYVAELQIPVRAKAQVWRSEPPEGHCSLKASPKVIKSWVQRVVRLI